MEEVNSKTMYQFEGVDYSQMVCEDDEDAFFSLKSLTGKIRLQPNNTALPLEMIVY
jgi:hypothetical protein